MNTHNKHKNPNNQTQSRQQRIQQNQEHVNNQQVYTLQVIDDQSQMDGDTEGDITEYLSEANIITTGKLYLSFKQFNSNRSIIKFRYSIIQLKSPAAEMRRTIRAKPKVNFYCVTLTF